jgi:ABC-type nitrate/sulfonate/bicarbonate transport system ATPase subunit
VGGFSITTQPVEVRRAIGYVPQAVSVDGSLTGYENLLIFAKLYDIPHKEQAERIRAQLEFAGLTADAGRLVGQYSGGMVRRLESPRPRCIGRACSLSTNRPSGWIQSHATRSGNISSICGPTTVLRCS